MAENCSRYTVQGFSEAASCLSFFRAGLPPPPLRPAHPLHKETPGSPQLIVTSRSTFHSTASRWLHRLSYRTAASTFLQFKKYRATITERLALARPFVSDEIITKDLFFGVGLLS